MKLTLELHQSAKRSKCIHMPIGAHFVQQDGEDGDKRIMRKFVIALSTKTQQHVPSEKMTSAGHKT
jgi:hypothetical protein